MNMRAFAAWRVVLPKGVTERLVDLRGRDRQERYDITPAELEAGPPPESLKILARRLRKETKAGIIYRSVRNRPNGVCVAVFLEGVEAELRVKSARDEWEGFIRGEGQ